MATTIKDIAKRVNVNPSTVSRVINGTASISDETKEKIYRAMKELDYHPNASARSLVQGSTFTIGLVLDAYNTDAFSNSFFIRSVAAIEKVVQQKEYNLLISSDTTRQNDTAVKNLVLERKVDGIIIPVSLANDELIHLLYDNVPFVVMGEPTEKYKDVNWVDMDNSYGCIQAIEHLKSSGYISPIMFVEGNNTTFENKRVEGFYDLADKSSVIKCINEENEIHHALKKMMLSQKVDSIICPNNIYAWNTLKALKTMNISVPDDIGIVTFDNYPLAEYMDPPLTAIDIDTYKLGEHAAELLFKLMEKGELKSKSKLIETELIIRKSTTKGERI